MRDTKCVASNWIQIVSVFVFMASSFGFHRIALTNPPKDSQNRKNVGQEMKPHPGAIANSHAPGEVDNPKLVPFIVHDPNSLPGIVIDETAATLKGTWQYSTHTPPYVGLGYLHDQNSNKGKSSVTFTPNLPHDGTYEVRLAHCYNVRRSTNTPVTIRHATGETTLRINQQEIPKCDRLFRSLGRFKFKAGTKGWVRISNEGTKGKYVIADAVQFIPIPPRPD